MRLSEPFTVAALIALSTSCSSGLGNNIECNDAPVGSTSGHLTTGLFFGFDPSDPITAHAVAGGVIPGQTRRDDRSVVFYAFATESAADDAGAPGAGQRLDRHGAADANGASDVFVAAVVDDRIDERAFSYSLAGKFRHPRCMSCHTMAVADEESTLFDVTTHDGKPPGDPAVQDVPESEDNLCMRCHRFALAAVEDEGSLLNRFWRNPRLDQDADFRFKTTAQLAQKAREASDDHFQRDRRVTWALTSGMFTLPDPSVEAGFRVKGFADDDQDGIAEPSDTDGRRRLVPGGRAVFLAETEAFLCGGPVDTRDAIADVVLVSRRADVAQSGSGPSSEPDVAYVPDPDFDPDFDTGGDDVAGTLFVAFTSGATDLRGSAATLAGATQVYVAELALVARQDGEVELRFERTTLVSAGGASAPDGGDEDSGSPSISADGARVAFASRATNLGTNLNGVQHVYVSGSLVQITPADADADAAAPALDPTGELVAFEWEQDFDAGDSNGLCDVYYAPVDDGGDPADLRRASEPNDTGAGDSDASGPSGEPDVFLSPTGAVLVAFGSRNELDTAPLDPLEVLPAENVFLHVDDRAGSRSTHLLTVVRTARGNTEVADGDTRRPVFAGRFDRIVVETDATNLDSEYPIPADPAAGVLTEKSGDENGASDVVLLDLAGLDLTGALGLEDDEKAVRAEGLSIGPAGAFGDGASRTPVAGTFATPGPPSAFVGFLALLTEARNLGAADNHQSHQHPTPWISFVAGEVLDPGAFAQAFVTLRVNCLGCHGSGSPDGAFMGAGGADEVYANLLAGTGSNPCLDPPSPPFVVPGDADQSYLVQILEADVDCVPRMPTGGPLSAAQIQAVRDWVAGGAPR